MGFYANRSGNLLKILGKILGKIPPLVYVVIPNKNGLFHLSYSLQSLEKTTYSNFRVVVVDNGSTDESISYILTHYSQIKVIPNAGKPGFAGGVNTGIKFALENGAEYIAVFSNDIKVQTSWIDLALDIFSKKPDAGLIGFKEILKENEQAFFAADPSRDGVECRDAQRTAGCLFFCQSKLFRTIGFLDEDYYMYGEDNDLFSRVLKGGFKIIETSIPVWHFGEGYSRHNKFLPTWLAYRNALRFSIKNEPPQRVLRMILSLLNQGCNPLYQARKHDPNSQRLRRYNILFNLILIIASCTWNITHLRDTLNSRRRQKNTLGN